ncbi:MAG: hypothetical protein JST32_16265 [Bacteroidetes bacterium]|nr:hypothetical protein [Bacteroidota bacterium]
MFNNFLNSFHQAIKNTYDQGHLKGGLSKDFFADLASNPIKQIVKFQKKYYMDELRKVGGKVNVVCMTNNGSVEIFKNL